MKTAKVHPLGFLLILGVCILALVPSCAHKSPLKDKMFIQSYGMDGQFVITVDATKLNLGEYVDTSSSDVDYVAQRMSRLSIVLFDKTGEYLDYPADLSVYNFDGAIEGDYSKTLLSAALKMSNLFTAEKGESGLKLFVDETSGLQVAIPSNGIILFSSDSVEESYQSTFKSSEKLISDDQAQKLASCEIGIYVSNPKTLIDLGLEVPRSSLENIEYILLMLNGDTFSIDFKLKNEELAKSFSVIIKGSYVGQLRRAGETIDFEQLKEQFVQEFDMVSVKNLGLTQEQNEAIKNTITGLLEVFNFGGTT